MITGSINLSALKHAVKEVNAKNGKTKALIIPLKENYLEQHANGNVYMNIVAFENKKENEFSTHMVKQSLKKDVRDAMSEDEKMSQPILGNLMANAQGKQEQAPNTDANLDLPSSDVDDDMPF
ncbi:MAG: hypothetical protein PF486_14070 [Prolixibacteraceae bacterium]|jgi:spore germination cell wall hydrolase CwlJ-like protein|nr:hypothetical protein [Prolixibacteraceae bacterium]